MYPLTTSKKPSCAFWNWDGLGKFGLKALIAAESFKSVSLKRKRGRAKNRTTLHLVYIKLISLVV